MNENMGKLLKDRLELAVRNRKKRLEKSLKNLRTQKENPRTVRVQKGLAQRQRNIILEGKIVKC
jgi:hypothetical protein